MDLTQCPRCRKAVVGVCLCAAAVVIVKECAPLSASELFMPQDLHSHTESVGSQWQGFNLIAALSTTVVSSTAGRRAAANLLTRDKAQRIALGIAKLPELAKRPQH